MISGRGNSTFQLGMQKGRESLWVASGRRYRALGGRVGSEVSGREWERLCELFQRSRLFRLKLTSFLIFFAYLVSSDLWAFPPQPSTC